MSYVVQCSSTKNVLAYAVHLLASSFPDDIEAHHLDEIYQMGASDDGEVVFKYEQLLLLMAPLSAEIESLRNSMSRITRVLGIELVNGSLDYQEYALKLQSCSCMLAVLARGLTQTERNDIVFTTKEK